MKSPPTIGYGQNGLGFVKKLMRVCMMAIHAMIFTPITV
jgi:hypothetical protein